MSEVANSLTKTLGQAWDSCVSFFDDQGNEGALAAGGKAAKPAAKVDSAASSFRSATSYSELRKIEKNPPRESDPEPKPVPADESPTGLQAPQDEHLEQKYREVDAQLDEMVSETHAAVAETLGLAEGQALPREMTVVLHVSGSPDAPKEISVAAVKAGPNFRYRVPGTVVDRSSADLSVAAKRKAPSALFPAYVDLSKITDDQGRITVTLRPDGSYELVQPKQPSKGDDQAIGA